MATFWALLGAIASIFSAVISFWQAKKSRKAAREAKEVRKELIDHRKTSELAHLQAVCKKAQNSIGKYGPSSIPSNLCPYILLFLLFVPVSSYLVNNKS